VTLIVVSFGWKGSFFVEGQEFLSQQRYNEGLIKCMLPPGGRSDTNIIVSSGSQLRAPMSFHYDPPLV
jgi:chromate transport protein ChrA